MMFSLIVNRLHADVGSLESLLRATEWLRLNVATLASISSPASGSLPMMPQRVVWQTCDHCTAFVRLYALFEKFLEDCVEHYLAILTNLNLPYRSLPEATRVQHRIGVGQILAKWNDTTSRFSHLTEDQVVRGLAQGLTSSGKYTILADAFLIESNNYRLHTVSKILSGLGIENCLGRISNSKPVQEHLGTVWSSTETAQSLLKQIVDYRNEASHGTPGTLVSLGVFAQYAQFVTILCSSIASVLRNEIYTLVVALKQYNVVGEIIRDFGRAKGLDMAVGKVKVGDELIWVRGTRISGVSILSLQRGSTSLTEIDATSPEQIGLVASARLRKGDALFRANFVV